MSAMRVLVGCKRVIDYAVKVSHLLSGAVNILQNKYYKHVPFTESKFVPKCHVFMRLYALWHSPYLTVSYIVTCLLQIHYKNGKDFGLLYNCSQLSILPFDALIFLLIFAINSIRKVHFLRSFTNIYCAIFQFEQSKCIDCTFIFASQWTWTCFNVAWLK